MRRRLFRTLGRMVRRWSAVVVAVLLIFIGLDLAIGKATATPDPKPISGNGPVVVIGLPGLRWHDITADATPQLWQLLSIGATGSVSVRAVTTQTCTPTGWLSMSAGVGVSPGTGDSACTPKTPKVSGHTATWPNWSQWQRDAKGDTTIGALATTLERHGQCVQAVGPGAGLAAADEHGRVSHYASSIDNADLSSCAATFVDLGTRATATRASMMRALNTAIGKVPADSTVILTGLSDGAHPSGMGDAHLRMLYAVGPGVPHGQLWSSSTKQPGLLQAADISATILQRGVAKTSDWPSSMTGQPLEVLPDKSSVASAVQNGRDLDELLHHEHGVVGWLYAGLGLLLLVAAVGEWHGWRRKQPSPRWVRPLAVFACAVPVATFVSTWVPWWRVPPADLWLVVTTAAFAGLVTGAAYAGPWRRTAFGPFVLVGVATMLVLLLDVMNGTRLQLVGMLGLQPVLGGRYYGMGNVGFTVLATATLVVETGAAAYLVDREERRLAAASVVLIGLAAAVVDAAPQWGADLGGPPALVIATLLLAALALGMRMTWRRIGAIVVVAVVIAVLGAVADWLRPAGSRTHLGRFVQQLIDGSGWSVIGEKLAADLRLVFGTPVTPLVPIILIVVIVLMARPSTRPGRAVRGVLSAVPFLWQGAIAVITCWAIGFAMNDSGVVIPTVGALIGVPVVIGVHTFREEDQADTADASSPVVE